MAYYSDMAIEIRRDKYLELLKSIRQISNQSTKESILNLLKSAAVKRTSDNKYIALKWTQIKWDINHGDIGFLDKFLDNIVENESADDYRIIRIGDDFADIEIFGSSSSIISLTREIRM